MRISFVINSIAAKPSIWVILNLLNPSHQLFHTQRKLFPLLILIQKLVPSSLPLALCNIQTRLGPRFNIHSIWRYRNDTARRVVLRINRNLVPVLSSLLGDITRPDDLGHRQEQVPLREMLAGADPAPSPKGEELRACADGIFLDVLQLSLPPFGLEGAGVFVYGRIVVYEMRVDNKNRACGDPVAIVRDVLC